MIGRSVVSAAVTKLRNFLMTSFSSSPSTSVSFGFIRDDIRNQIANSRAILSHVGLLQKALPKVTDDEARKLIQQAIDGLLATANSMANNVVSTTTTASSTISGVLLPSDMTRK